MTEAECCQAADECKETEPGYKQCVPVKSPVTNLVEKQLVSAMKDKDGDELCANVPTSASQADIRLNNTQVDVWKCSAFPPAAGAATVDGRDKWILTPDGELQSSPNGANESASKCLAFGDYYDQTLMGGWVRDYYCSDARAYGGGEQVWRYNSKKQLVNGYAGLCLELNLGFAQPPVRPRLDPLAATSNRTCRRSRFQRLPARYDTPHGVRQATVASSGCGAIGDAPASAAGCIDVWNCAATQAAAPSHLTISPHCTTLPPPDLPTT